MEICSDQQKKKKTQEFDTINFSSILKKSFHVTLNANKTKILLTKGDLLQLGFNNCKFLDSNSELNSMGETKEREDREAGGDSLLPTNAEDISLIAGTIVTNANHIPQNLFCPFCADEFMFEFTLKDHLKRNHVKEICERNPNDLPESEQQNFSCPYCEASFFYSSVIPKHVALHHGRNWLQHWQRTHRKSVVSDNLQKLEPEIIYASCSPGLSDIFDKLLIRDFEINSIDSPQLKSILKKTPTYSKSFLYTPSSASVRRAKSGLLKRSLSARRELRFDLPPLNKSLSPIVRKHKKMFDLVNLFRKFKQNSKINNKIVTENILSPISNQIMNKSSKSSIKKRLIKNKYKKVDNIESPKITSTPIYFLEDDILEESPKKRITKKEIKNNGVDSISNRCIINKNRPLLLDSERFQCNCCNEKYSSNLDLLMHLKNNHKSLKNILKPNFKCSQCQKKFYKNSTLTKHCLDQHTPQKKRISGNIMRK